MGSKHSGAWVCCCCLLILFAIGMSFLGITEIVMGAVYFHDCSLENMIPIYLIVSGVGPSLVFNVCKGNKKNMEEEESIGFSAIRSIVGTIFSIVWHVLGSIWVYPNYGLVHGDSYIPCYDSDNETDTSTMAPRDCTEGTCDNTLLDFSFIMVTLNWVYTGVMIANVVSIFLQYMYTGKEKTTNY